jgi:L-threonylcarbamoyladenylate synthase
MADVIVVDPASPDPTAIARAAERLRLGGLVAFPTETVYGLGAHAFDRDAIRRVFQAKGRPGNDPLIVHVASLEDIAALTLRLPRAVEPLALRFWPGPLTLVLPRSAAVPDEVTAGLATVGIRVPAHTVARALLAAAAVPVAAPSANLFSRPSPTTAAHVLEDLAGRIDIVLDGGPTTFGVESTVLDLSRDVPVILRPGAVTREMLLEVLPRVDSISRHGAADSAAGEGAAAMPSPGMLTKHYSPRAPLTLYEGPARAVSQRMKADAASAIAQGRAVGIIAAGEDDIGMGRVVALGPIDRPDIVAARLYSGLRELDAAGMDLILARQFPSDTGLGRAVRDRLSRAAAGRVIQL